MSHFAKIEKGVVTQVIVATQEHIDTLQKGQWVKTSYNTKGGVHYNPNSKEASNDQTKALRLNFAGIGSVYDEVLDAFYVPQPYPSWSLDVTTGTWLPPTPRPADVGKPPARHIWDEEAQQWLAP